MSDRSSVAFRIMGGRVHLLGPEDSLESITTTTLDSGALCYVQENDTHYSLNRLSSASPNPPTVIKPAIGPGRWTVATGGTQGAQGPQGATGVQGPQGTQGAGFQGAQGATGTQGSQGAQGTQGAGFQGAQGFQGATGVQGGQGFQGATGSQGNQGLQGAQGATGTQGAQGNQGSQGTGSQGAQGATGTQGPGGGAQGAQGATGVQGSQGSQGATGAGTQGAQGAQGGTGVQGNQGATGAGTQGSQGAQGGAGVQGSQGAQGATGTGAQGAQGSQGSVGLQGAQGSQGFQGARGLQGFQGAQGNTGLQGAQGNQGATGLGTQGNQGATGAQGFQGSQGAGNQGAQGATGTQGTAGAQGAAGSGAQGSQGFQGATGTQGSQGFQGARGLQGALGTTGLQGFQGATGVQGNQGATGAGTQGAQGGTGLQGAAGAQGATGAGTQGAQGATGLQGAAGAQGATGVQGSQGSQGASGAGFNPLNQVYYVDALNSGVQTGSIAQPYISIAAALTARTSNVTLLVAPGTYSTTIAVTGNRNCTIIGLCEPGQQQVVCQAVTLNNNDSFRHTLTLQNLSVTTITDSSTTSVSPYILLIDTIASGTITGNGGSSSKTVVELSSVQPSSDFGSMSVQAITAVSQLIAENAVINGVFSVSSIDNTAPNTLRGCRILAAPTTGPLVCYDTTLAAGFTAPSGASAVDNYFYDCTIDGDMAQTAGTTARVYLWNCRLSTASATTSMAIGNFNRMELRGCKFGVKSTGHVTITGISPNLFFDAESEKDFWKNGLGRISTTFSNGVWTTLDAGDPAPQTMSDGNITADPSIAVRFIIPTGTALTAARDLTLPVAGIAALGNYYVDNYGPTAPGSVNVKVGATTLANINSTSVKPQRYKFTVTEDGLTIVYNGLEYLG